MTMLSHWLAPAPHLLRLDATLLTPDAPTRLAERMPGEMGEMEDELVSWNGTFATEDPWRLRLWSYDPEKRTYAPRWTAFRLKLSPRTVAADLGTPAGVPVYWNHMSWISGALGRVQTMRAENQKLTGTFSLSSVALAGWGTSFAQIDAGMNSGLSVGVRLIDQPTFKRAKGDDGGSWDKPDEVMYGRVVVKELSLTPMPMIEQAGVTGRQETTNA